MKTFLLSVRTVSHTLGPHMALASFPHTTKGVAGLALQWEGWLSPASGDQKTGQDVQSHGLEEVAMDERPASPDAAQAVLPNNILVLSGCTVTPASVILLKRAAASLLSCLMPSPAAPPIGHPTPHPSPGTVLLGLRQARMTPSTPGEPSA